MKITDGIALIALLVSVFAQGAAFSSSGKTTADEPKEFSLSVFNGSGDLIEFLTHNTEPLAAVPSQELSKYRLKPEEGRDVELDSPYFVVRSNRNAYYALVKLSGDIVDLAQKIPLKLTLKPIAARMLLVIDNIQNPKAPETIKMNFIDLENAPKQFDNVEDDLLEKVGIERQVKHAPSFYRQYLRASM